MLLLEIGFNQTTYFKLILVNVNRPWIIQETPANFLHNIPTFAAIRTHKL